MSTDPDPGLAEEFRTLAAAALDRLQPWVDQLCAAQAAAAACESAARAHDAPVDHGDAAETSEPTAPTACGVCPVCSVIAVLRGERPELGMRLAEQGAAMLAALRAALDEGGPAEPASASAQPASPRRGVQRIPVERVAVVPVDGESSAHPDPPGQSPTC